jgi:hypothetical protein
MQAFIGGITASGVVACGLRLLTKSYFEKYGNGLRKGACTLYFFSCVLSKMKYKKKDFKRLDIFGHSK